MKHIALDIFRETLAALDIRAALERSLEREGDLVLATSAKINLREYRDILAVVYGKASLAMAAAFNDLVGAEWSFEGILAAPSAPERPLAGWHTFVTGHPMPDGQSLAAGRAILNRLARCDERTLIFFLLSGGGSSLVEAPLDSRATLEDFRQMHRTLVGCGAPIEEINIVRRHVSATKGGRLASAAPRSMKLTFGVSDVPLGMEIALGSGPTLPDPTTLADADRVIREHNLRDQLPAIIRDAFEQHTLPETPKEGDPAFAHTHFRRILSMHDLTHSAHHACEARGYACVCDYETDNWPLEKAADFLLAMLARQKRENPGRRVAVVASGEVSSPVTGNGIGGRNSAFVLTCVPKIAGQNMSLLSVGTDGIDGNSPAAGAIADGESLARAQTAGLDPADFLRRCDAYHFFERLGDAIVTGRTGNNVRDLRVLLAEA